MSAATFRRSNYSGYLIRERQLLLAQLAAAGVPPRFERVIAEHVTYAYPDPQPAPSARTVQVVGHASGDGVQALLVQVDGTTRRPDGRLFHLTYSLGPGHKPVESNMLLLAAERAGQIEAIDPLEVTIDAF